jgi:hypothetical protein
MTTWYALAPGTGFHERRTVSRTRSKVMLETVVAVGYAGITVCEVSSSPAVVRTRIE